MTNSRRLAWPILGVLGLCLAGAVGFRRSAELNSRRTLLASLSGRLDSSVVADLCPQCKEGDELPYEVLIPQARVWAARGKRASARSLGVAFLLLDQPEEAVAKLSEACRLAPRDARLKSDLSAAYLDLAEKRKKPYARLQALAAADAALQLHRLLPEATTNRALALEGLFLTRAAHDQWELYLRIDPDSAWADEARHRLRLLSSPSSTEEWDESRPILDRAALGGEQAKVDAIVERFTMSARLYAEDQLLADWGKAYLEGTVDHGAPALARARSIGEALARCSGNFSVADAVAAIDRARWNPEKLAALAAGHRAYRAGRDAYTVHLQDQARSSLEEARRELARGGSPFAASARLFHAGVDYNSFHYAGATVALEQLARDVPLARYPVLQGQLEWLLGVMQYEDGRADGALAHHLATLAAFNRAHEAEYVAAAEDLIALDHAYVGNSEEEWSHRHEALRRLAEVQAPKRRYEIFINTAIAALKQGMPTVALLFEDEAVNAAERWRSLPALAEAHWWRSRILRVFKEPREALADLEEAKRASGEVADPGMRQRIDGDLLMTEGESLLPADPARSIDRFTQAFKSYESLGSADFLADILLQRANAFQAIGQPERARADLERGVELYEDRRLKISDEQNRIAYFDQSDEIFDAMIRFEVERGESASAFDYVERARARTLLELTERVPPPEGEVPEGAQTVRPWSLSEIRSRMPAGVVLIEYAVLPDRVLAWRIRRDDVRFRPLALDAAGLRSAVGALRSALAVSAPAEQLSQVSSQLYTALVGPFAPGLRADETLVFVPDKELHDLPFAALLDPRTRRYLVEERPLVNAASATLYLRARERERRPGSGRPSALVVGNPVVDSHRYPDLAPLRHAEREATAVASLYGSVPLLAENARVASFRRLAPSSEVLHLAAHGILNREAPAWSKLLLTSEGAGGAGELHAWEIRRLDLRRTRLAVLSACSSAGGTIWKNEGVSSLANAFLSAGVGSVVAPLWNVDDGASAELMIDFHRNLRQGLAPAAALRAAQLSLLYGQSTAWAHPTSWAGFQVLGGS